MFLGVNLDDSSKIYTWIIPCLILFLGERELMNTQACIWGNLVIVQLESGNELCCVVDSQLYTLRSTHTMLYVTLPLSYYVCSCVSMKVNDVCSCSRHLCIVL